MRQLRFELPSLFFWGWSLLSLAAAMGLSREAGAAPPLPPLYERFAPAESGDDKSLEGHKRQPPTDEVPNFQKHISPLLGRLGCNGRACHGSFQGQAGFQLSLFGYDFTADHRALLEAGAGRVDLQDKLQSLILTKPVDAEQHEGGQRFEAGGWQYWVLRRWIESEAPYQSNDVQRLVRLQVTPAELSFSQAGQTQQLRAIAYWEDGTSEDVTCLCRFQSNDTARALIDEQGRVTSGEAGDTHVVVSYDNAVVPVLAYRPLSEQTGEAYPPISSHTEVDRLVIQKLKKLGVLPSPLCSDEEFLRRASLDVTGTLPQAEEVLAFAADSAADKRERKIEELLARPTYAAQWTTFFCDLTGNNEDQLRNFLPQQVRPENQWYQWLYQRLQDNVPYDQIVEGIVTATSRLPQETYRQYCAAMSEICQDASGEKFAERPGLVHFWARNNFRTPEERAIGFAYSFLGVRIQCAQCHKHPFDQWSKSDFDQFERLFGAVQASQNSLTPDARSEFRQMVADLDVDRSLKGNQLRRALGELLRQGAVVPFPELTIAPQGSRPRKAKAVSLNASASQRQAKLLGGALVTLDETDVRMQLMDWLRSADNPYFAKAIVNRIWAQYFGVGIVHPADDLNLANAPSNAPLLDYLASGFRQQAYDLKWLHREILRSAAYQRSWQSNASNVLDERNFSHSLLRRMPAETAYDAVRMALANDAIRARAGSLDAPRAITKAGASARNSGRDDLSYALSIFGRSIRESNCDCDRSSEPSLLQTVFLVNDSAVQDWLHDRRTGWVSQVAEKYDWPLPGVVSDERGKTDQRVQLQRLMDNLAPRKERLERRRAVARQRDQPQMLVKLEQQQRELARQAARVAKKQGLQDALQDDLQAWLQGQATSAAAPVTAPVTAPATAPAASPLSEEQAGWIIENAYLRTLSRQPTPAEIATAEDFLRSEEEPTEAVAGLLWSLINTKEFILNH